MKLRTARNIVPIVTLTLCLVGGQLAPWTRQVVHAESSRRPHVIFILTDDLDEVVTDDGVLRQVMPFTTALRDRGVRLQNTYSAAICCEARSGILTGLYPHNNGVYTNSGSYGGYQAFRNPLDAAGLPMLDRSGGRVDNEKRTFARYLNDAGYRTILIGKYMNGFEPSSNGELPAPPIGWTDGHVAIGNSFYSGYNYQLLDWSTGTVAPSVSSYGSAESDYSTDVVSRLATQFIDESASRRPGQPFLMYLASTAPHLPLPAAPRHAALAAQWQGTLPTNRPNFYADGDTVLDKPSWLKGSWLNRGGLAERGWTQRDWYLRLGSLYAVDEMVKSVYQRLEANGQLDDTLLVFTSDNGYNLGAHRLNHKMAPYEESVRVPAFVWAGKNLGFRSAATLRGYAQHIDYAPTFLELAGLSVLTAPMDGKSLVPLLRGDAVSWRSDFVAEYKGGEAIGPNALMAELPPSMIHYFTYYGLPSLLLDVPTYAMLRSSVPAIENGVRVTKEYAYIEWYESGPESPSDVELYDLSKDPFELDNLNFFNRAGCGSLIQAFAQRLKAMRGCSGRSCFTPPSYSSSAMAMDVSTCRKSRR